MSKGSSGLHYTKSGGLDMRYSSSKAYVASHSTSSYSSTSSSSSSSGLHYTKSGGLDMRYNSSKAYVDSQSTVPRYNSDGLHYRMDGGLDMRYNSSKPSSSSSDLHYRQDGGLDMRYNSSRDIFGVGRISSMISSLIKPSTATTASSTTSTSTESTNRTVTSTPTTSTPVKKPNSPANETVSSTVTTTEEKKNVAQSSTKTNKKGKGKRKSPQTATTATPTEEKKNGSQSSTKTKGPYDIKRSPIKESEKPTQKGKDRAHIFPWELLNHLNQKRKGRPLKEDKERYKKIQEAMNSKENLRYKTEKGNRGSGKDEEQYWKSDRDSDKRIRKSLDDPSKPLTQFDFDRAKRQLKFISESGMDQKDKDFLIEYYSKLKDTNGNSIVESESKLDE